jgi:hypothetical protein
LNENRDLAEPGIQAIAQGEIDNAILPAEGNRRLRTLVRQREQSLAFTPANTIVKIFLIGWILAGPP